MSQNWARGDQYTEQAKALHATAPVVDGHCDALYALTRQQRDFLGEPLPAAPLSLTANPTTHFDFTRARSAGIWCQVLTMWVPPELYPAALPQALAMADRLERELAEAAGAATLVRTQSELHGARQRGQLAVLLAMEGAEPLVGGLPTLRAFYRLGLRVLGLTWNHRNALADGVGELATGGGLTSLGREVVAECNQLGVVIDTAHLSPAGLADVLALSRHPVLFSHGNCMALHEHRRNLTDEQLRSLADQGGLFGVSLCPAFMGQPATVETVADHIEHAVQVMGADHVALGTDFDGITATPIGLEEVSCLANLTEVLLRRGWAEATVCKILGENYQRLFAQVLPR